MQSDQIKIARQHMVNHAPRIVLGHVTVPRMSPPDDDVGPFKIDDRQSLFRVVQSDRPKLQIVRRSFQLNDNFIAQKIVVSLCLPWLPLIPDQHMNRLGGWRSSDNGA